MLMRKIFTKQSICSLICLFVQLAILYGGKEKKNEQTFFKGCHT